MGNKVHFILQGKGGVGKSFIASLLAQHYQNRTDGKVVCVDTDPANATLLGYKALGARRAEILEEGSTSRINPRAFDALLNGIAAEDADFIVDNGASCFLPLTDYLVETQALEALAEAGKEVYLHSVVTGAQALRDTVRGLDSLASYAPPAAKLIVWLNEYFGPIEVDGKKFEEMGVYEKHRDRISAIVRLPKQNPYTSGKDLELMVARKLTFAEALKDGAFGLMEKQRIRSMQKSIFEQLQLVA